jgi:hypothetical protein
MKIFPLLSLRTRKFYAPLIPFLHPFIADFFAQLLIPMIFGMPLNSAGFRSPKFIKRDEKKITSFHQPGSPGCDFSHTSESATSLQTGMVDAALFL